MKPCTKCKIEKPETEFYKNKKGKNGLLNSCKDCCKKWWDEHKPPKKVKSYLIDGLKICPKCNEKKSIELFYKTNKGGYSYCKNCMNKYQHERYRKLHPESIERKPINQYKLIQKSYDEVLLLVADGIPIIKALKKLNIHRRTFYKYITLEQRLELKGAKKRRSPHLIDIELL